MEDLSSGLTFFYNCDKKKNTASGNTVSAPLIGSKVIRIHLECKGVIGFKVRRQIRHKLSPVRGRPIGQWSEQAPLKLGVFGFGTTLAGAPSQILIATLTKEGPYVD